MSTRTTRRLSRHRREAAARRDRSGTPRHGRCAAIRRVPRTRRTTPSTDRADVAHGIRARAARRSLLETGVEMLLRHILRSASWQGPAIGVCTLLFSAFALDAQETAAPGAAPTLSAEQQITVAVLPLPADLRAGA